MVSRQRPHKVTIDAIVNRCFGPYGMMKSPHRRSLKEFVALGKNWLLDKSDAMDLTKSETIEIVN